MSLCIKKPSELEEALKKAVENRLSIRDILDEHANVLAEVLVGCRGRLDEREVERIVGSLIEALALFNVAYTNLMFGAEREDENRYRRILRLLARMLIRSNEMTRTCDSDSLEKARRRLEKLLDEAGSVLEDE